MTATPANASLRPMRRDEFADFWEHSNDGYARAIAAEQGLPDGLARQKAEADHAVLSQGLDTPGHWLFVVEADGHRVGTLWLAERDDGGEKQCWIYEIEIDEAYRSRGFGRAAMELAEVEARSHGMRRIALSVYGGNDVARNLYRSLGYVETSVKMAKNLRT